MKKAIFLDIDGTLIKSSLTPFDDDMEEMREAARRGHFLCLNTGRAVGNIPRPLIDLQPIQGISAGGGAHILIANSAKEGKDRFETIYRQWIFEEALAKIFAYHEKHTKYCVLEGERDCYIINSTFQPEMVKSRIPVKSLDDFRSKSRGDLITKVTFDGLAPEDECLLLEPYMKIGHFAHYSEGIINGENKAKGMELVVKHLGLRREDSIAIGDGLNDMDMFRYAGLGIAMGNACAELKAVAGAVTGECGKGGVAEALRKFAP